MPKFPSRFTESETDGLDARSVPLNEPWQPSARGRPGRPRKDGLPPGSGPSPAAVAFHGVLHGKSAEILLAAAAARGVSPHDLVVGILTAVLSDDLLTAVMEK